MGRSGASSGPGTLAKQLAGGFRDAAAKVACAFQFGLAWLAAAVATSVGGGTIRRAADQLIMPHLPGVAIIKPDDRHGEVQQVADDREQRRFLPAVLRGRGGEGRPNLADQGAARPQPPGLIQESRG